MTIKTGNTIKDDVLKAFQKRYRMELRNGSRTSVRNLLSAAIAETGRNPSHDMRDVRRVCEADEAGLLAWCDKIALSLQKSGKVAQIRRNNAAAVVDSFIAERGLDCTYSLTDTYVNLVFRISPTNQTMRVKLSFKKLESVDYQEALVNAVNAISALAEKVGKVTMKWF